MKASYSVALKVTWAKNGDSYRKCNSSSSNRHVRSSFRCECTAKVKKFLCRNDFKKNMQYEVRDWNLFCNRIGWKYGNCQPSTTVLCVILLEGGLCAILLGWRNDIFHVLLSNATRNNRFGRCQRTLWFFFTIRTVIGVICGYMHRRCSFNDWQALGVCSSYQRKSTKHYHTHCMIHREVLDAKHLGQFLPEVSLNSIKARPLQFRMFSKLCDERG